MTEYEKEMVVQLKQLNYLLKEMAATMLTMGVGSKDWEDETYCEQFNDLDLRTKLFFKGA